MRVLIPAALRQCPQLVCEIRMARSTRALAIHYRQQSHGSRAIIERNPAGKYLWWYETAVSQSPNNPSTTHLDHNHREGENIRSLAICPLLVEYLWRSPSCDMDIILVVWIVSHRIQALNDRRKTKIRDPWVAGRINKDIWLDTRQWYNGT